MKYLPLIPFLLGYAHAAPLQRVAYDDAGDAAQQPHLIDGEDWMFKHPGDATPAARSCVFGSAIRFGYGGLKANAAYKVRLTLFADAARTMRVMAGDIVLGEVKAERDKTTTVEFDIPAAARKGTNLQLTLEKTSGPNAVVSEVEILSDEQSPLSTVSADPALAEELQRLSPQPLTPAPSDPAHTLSLNGEWRFNPEPAADFWTRAASEPQSWKPIHVPGEWALQGFTVKANASAAYRRTFAIPGAWSGRCTILRFDAVHSACKLYLNGKAVGEHIGAFLPFEFDLSAFLQPGENRLDLAVCNESIADTLAKGSHYASHPIGGILRKVQLISVPRIHASGLDLRTELTSDLREGSVKLSITVANRSDAVVSPVVSARLVPVGILGIPLDAALAVPVSIGSIQLPSVAAGVSAPANFSIKLPKPHLWHAESPFLYRAEVTLSVAGKAVETIGKNCGFRRIEVIDRRVCINGKIAKLKGVCRHSVHPTLGRALTPELIRKDAELFKAANCNFIRTSHYPAEEEFIDLCDQLGLFVMDEAPVCWCWDGCGNDPAVHDYLFKTHLGLVSRDRHHPSVIIWSLANESGWSSAIEKSAGLVKLADPSRLLFFSHSEYFGIKGRGLLDIGTRHYPDWNHLKQYESYFRPMIFDEWAHLNAYNEREILTDPAIRDLWGGPVEKMWSEIAGNRNSAGVAIWGGIDEKFFLDGKPVGYGPWGVLDGWRREKPEYWHLKKTFSPVRFTANEISVGGSQVSVPVENRYQTLDFSTLTFHWSCGSAKGQQQSNLPARTAGKIEFLLPASPAPNSKLEISAMDPLGRMIDCHVVTLNPQPETRQSATRVNGNITCVPTRDGWSVTSSSLNISISSATGLFSVQSTAGKVMVNQAPYLMLLPSDNSRVKVVDGVPIALAGHETDGSTLFSAVCKDWKAESVTLVKQSPECVEFLVKGKYAEAAGQYTYLFTSAGCVIRSKFLVTVNLTPRQIGVVFDLPSRFQTLSWKRKGYWSCYPENHIGRLQGSAIAFPQKNLPDLNGPRQQPDWDWSQDTLVFGSNDFRSTKHNIYFAQLVDADQNALRVNSDANQHSRCWIENASTRFLVATFSAQGAEHYFSMMSGFDRISYDPSSSSDERSITNTIHLEFVSSTKGP